MGYVGNAPAEKYTTIDKQTLTGNNTVGPYTLTHSVGNEQEIEVFVNNVRQEPGVSYTVSSNQLTMSASVASADDFYVIFQGKAKMTATHPPTFDLTAANGTFTGTVTTGGLTVGSDTAKTKFYSNSTYNGIYNGSTLTNNESIYMGSGTLFFYSGGGERMRIDSSGNVGIAIAPQSFAKLQVKTSTDRNVAVFDNAAGTTIGGITDAGASTSLRIAGQNLIFTGNGGSGAEHMRIDSSGNLLVGTTSTIDGARITSVASGSVSLGLNGSGGAAMIVRHPAANQIDFTTTATNSFFTFSSNTVERMRIDSSGNLLVGKTVSSFSTAGTTLLPSGNVTFTRSGAGVIDVNRLSSDGSIVNFYKDGSTVGSIGVNTSRLTIGSGDTGLLIASDLDNITPYNTSTNASRDNAVDLGNSSVRFKDLYLSGGIQFDSRSNKLDDYEEGTWSPVLNGTSGNATMGSGTIGFYTKVGNLVHVTGTMLISGNGSNANSYTKITGLPFPVNGNGGARQVGVIGAWSGCNDSEKITLVADPSNTFIYVIKKLNNTYSHNNTFASTASLYGFSLVYQTA